MRLQQRCRSFALGLLGAVTLLAGPAFAEETKHKDITIAVSNMGMSGEWFSDWSRRKLR